MKQIPPLAETFNIPLVFGEWTLEDIDKVVKEMREIHDLTNYELEYVSRGGYSKCQGYNSHEACDEMLKTNGKIVFKKKEDV